MLKLADNISTLHNIARRMGHGNSTRVNPLVPTSVMAPGVNFNNTSDDPLHPSVSVNGKPPQSFVSAAQAEEAARSLYRQAANRSQPLSHSLPPDVMAKLVNTFPALEDAGAEIRPGRYMEASNSAMYGNNGVGFMNTRMMSPTPSRQTVSQHMPSPWNAYSNFQFNRGSLNDIYSTPRNMLNRSTEKYRIPLPNFSL